MSEFVDTNPRHRILDDAIINSSSTGPPQGHEEVDHVTLQDDSNSDSGGSSSGVRRAAMCADIVSVGVLCAINLLNYMDRFTVAAVLQQVQEEYGVDNTMAGLLQTSFIVTYMLLSPLFGYFGDRAVPGTIRSRKVLMLAGVTFWSAITLASSFVPSNMFGLFLLTRCLVGVGEASYNTVATPIVADLFVGNARTFALIVFNLQVPLGSGLGYVIGSQVTALANDNWRWSLRVTPPLGVCCVLLLLLLFTEPRRGQAEHATHVQVTDWRQDVRHLLRNRSFVLNTLGFTAVCFVTGALSWWTPTLLKNDLERWQVPSQPGTSPAPDTPAEKQAELAFGGVTCLAGILGVLLGTELARRLRPRVPNADPLVNAAGLLLAAPLVFATLLATGTSLVLTFCLVFVTEVFLCVNWALVNEITLKVTVPTRRSLANSLCILVSHLLGDAGSPWLIGKVTDALAATRSAPKSAEAQFFSLRTSMFVCSFVAALGGAAFLACSITYLADCARVLRIEAASNRFYQQEGVSYEPPSHSSAADFNSLPRPSSGGGSVARGNTFSAIA